MMLFIHTIDKVLSGEKTQTRRIVKAGECSNEWHNGGDDDMTINEVLAPRTKESKLYGSLWRNVYLLGKTYAAQPARGKPAVARIRILDIRREDVRQISNEDAKAEGFDSEPDFFYTWVSMHDSAYIKSIPNPSEKWIPEVHGMWIALMRNRPAARYDAWVLTFELVKS